MFLWDVQTQSENSKLPHGTFKGKLYLGRGEEGRSCIFLKLDALQLSMPIFTLFGKFVQLVTLWFTVFTLCLNVPWGSLLFHFVSPHYTRRGERKAWGHHRHHDDITHQFHSISREMRLGYHRHLFSMVMAAMLVGIPGICVTMAFMYTLPNPVACFPSSLVGFQPVSAPP